MSGHMDGEQANSPPAEPSAFAAGLGRRSGQPGAGASEPTGAAVDRAFGPDDLRDLRRVVAAVASRWGAVPDRVDALKLIVGELTANAVRYAAGRGRLRVWRRGGQIHCEVSDSGPGFRDPQRVGLHRPAPMSLGGRGIWLVRALADEVTIEGGRSGAIVTARIRLGAPVSTLWKQHAAAPGF
ncbi:MAG: ATP-binding protein [Hamadaea sp.]|nr:ATP-binding protein [Hamadaea sp.]